MQKKPHEFCMKVIEGLLLYIISKSLESVCMHPYHFPINILYIAQ